MLSRGRFLGLALLMAVLIAACGGSSPAPHRHASLSAAAPATATTPAQTRRVRHHRRADKRSRHARPARAHHTVQGLVRHHHAHAPASGQGGTASQTQPVAGSQGSTARQSHRSHRKRRHRKPRAPAAPPAETVSLELHGGTSSTVTACGLQHHQRRYPGGSTIKFSGSVKPIPNAQWKVKIKIKACQGGAYVDVSKFQVPVNKHTGTFAGTFSAPPAGFYEATARLYITDVEVAKSVERHFQIS